MFVNLQVTDDIGMAWSVTLRQRQDGHIQVIVTDLQSGGQVQLDERSFLLALYESKAFPLSSVKPIFEDLPKP
jgi:hypothetical protein